MAAKQAIFIVSPLSARDIKNEFRPPKTSFSDFRSRFSRSQSPAQPGKPVTTLERPRTSNGPGRRVDEFRGRDTKAKDDLSIRGSGHTTQALGTLPYNFPISALQTPGKAREITITPRKPHTSSTSASPAPSLYHSRDITPLGFKEHRAKLISSRESSRHRKNSSGYDQRLPLRELAENNQTLGGTHMASAQLQPEQLPIGMALGSPSQAPPNFQSMVAHTRGETMPVPRKSTSGQRPPRSESAHQPQVPPQHANPTTNIISAEKPVKVSKWKLFGRFGKKSAQEVAQDVEKFEHAAARDEEPIQLEVSKGKVERSRTLKEKKSTRALKKERPGLTRVTTAPTGAEETCVKEKTTVPFKGAGAFEESVDDIMAREQLKSNRAHGEVKEDGKTPNGLLAVDIPSIQMERYSVMFEQLLGSSTPTKKISTSNLLARRQATLDRLKTVNESIAELKLEEARLGVKSTQKSRRMTSPAASPSLALFPGHAHLTPSSAASPHNNASAQRLHRSNTSPAMLSPNRMTFPQHTRVEAEPRWTERNLVASPTSTVSDDPGPLTPDKHGQIAPVIIKAPSYVPPEPAWEMLESSTTKTRQRSNTARQRDNGLQSARAMAQRARANTASSRQAPLPSPRISNSSSASNSGSLQTTASANSSATNISSSSLNQRPIPKIKIRHKPALEPYPSGIVPGIPGGAPTPAAASASTSSLDVAPTATSGSSAPRESPVIQHPERGSSRQFSQPVPSPHLHSQDDLVHGMKIPVSRFSTAPARRLPQEVEKPKTTDEDEIIEEDQELQIRTAADVSIARQISISRQQSQMLKQRLACSEKRRREGKGIDEREQGREARLGRRHEKEKEIRLAIDDRGGLLQSQQRGLIPQMVNGDANRKSEYVVFESE